MNLSIHQISQFLSAQSLPENPSNIITGVSMDSRTVKDGDCFFAIKGEHFDGHQFVRQALDKGASCAIVNKDYNGDGAVIKVDDTIKAMGILANKWRNKLALKVVGITGSVGKTSTRNLIYHILSGFMSCYQSMKNYNNQIGLPFAILNIPEQTQSAVIELGASFKGEISYLSRIAEPDIAIITNTYPAHLAGFGSLSNIIKEKAAIADGLNASGNLLINAKMADLRSYLDSNAIGYQTFDVINGQTDGLTGSLELDNHIIAQIPLAGWGNLENAAAAWSVCKLFNIKAEQFAERIKSANPWQMRLEAIKLDKFTIINDCYNANPASMANAVDILANMGKIDKKRTVFICGDMKELGDQSEYFHKQLGVKAAQVGIDVFIACGELAAISAAEFEVNSTKNQPKTAYFNTSSEIAENLSHLIQIDDIILVKGSRSMTMEIITDTIKGL